jgi:5-methylcytosine-specific restriction endonuclease McrA
MATFHAKPTTTQTTNSCRRVIKDGNGSSFVPRHHQLLRHKHDKPGSCKTCELCSKSAKLSKRSNFSAQYKRSIAADQKWTCGHCANMLDEHYEIDHVRALADGGGNTRDNLWALCLTCHKDKTAEENDARFQLKHACSSRQLCAQTQGDGCGVIPFKRAQWRTRKTPANSCTPDAAAAQLFSLQGPTLQGPTLQGPTLQGPLLQGPTVQGPTVQGPFLQGPTVQGPTLQGPTLQGPTLTGHICSYDKASWFAPNPFF